MSFLFLFFGYILFHVFDSSLGGSGQKPSLHSDSQHSSGPPLPTEVRRYLLGPARIILSPSDLQFDVALCRTDRFLIFTAAFSLPPRKQLQRFAAAFPPERYGQKTFHIKCKVEFQVLQSLPDLIDKSASVWS